LTKDFLVQREGYGFWQLFSLFEDMGFAMSNQFVYINSLC